MVKTILFVFLFVLVVLGLCEVVYIAKMIFYYPGKRCEHYIIVVLENEYALKQLSYIWQKIKWYGNSYACGIIALTDFLNDDVVECCDKFSDGKNIFFCNSKSLN